MDNDKEETRDFIKEAEELLVDADNDLNRGDYKSCFSKSYHAMVSSLKALLNLLEKRQEKAEVENKFENMYNQILLIDQGIGLVLNEKEVRKFLKVAGNFVQDLKNRLKTFSFPT